MNTRKSQFPVVDSHPQTAARRGLPAAKTRATLLALLAASIFVAAAPAGMTTIAQVSQVSLHVLFEVCRLSAAVFQVFHS